MKKLLGRLEERWVAMLGDNCLKSTIISETAYQLNKPKETEHD